MENDEHLQVKQVFFLAVEVDVREETKGAFL